MNEYESWTWTDRDGREWLVTEAEEQRTSVNMYDISGFHSWSFEEGEVTQDLYAWKASPLMHREDVKTAFQNIVDEMNP